jgi:cardiolipin synthase
VSARGRGALEAVDRALSRAAGGRPIPGNAVDLLIDGAENYARMLEVIEGAKRWIHLENYMIHDDAVGRRFAEALARRARDGVRVRVLYDWLGSIGTGRGYWRRLRGAGVEVRQFHPPRPLEIVTNLARNHRKLLTADGERAVMGGLCLGCAWTGESAPDGQPWRDTGLGIDGPAAALLEQAFAGTWTLAGARTAVPAEETPGAVRPAGDAAVRVIAGEPGRERAYRVIELLAAGALDRLWITDAYLVAPARLVQALRDAARDGVDVRLLVPSSSDVPFVRNLTRIGYRELLRAGVRIWEWDGPMLHAKTIVADGRWTRVGSSNLNPSSLFGNYELDVLVEDAALAERMEHQFRRDVARSREVLRRPVRGLPRISHRLPSVLERHAPELPQPHRRSPREVRARAAVAVRALIANARRSVFGPISIALVLLSALFLFLPRTMGYVVGALCVWLAVGASREAFRRRADR